MCQAGSQYNEIQLGRRHFVRTVLAGGGVALLASVLPARYAGAAGQTEALLLSCMDFRLVDETERYMSGRGLRNKYDHVILAGAALGATTDKFPLWKKVFWEHLDVAIKLHKIHKVMVLDHRDCGAYKVVMGEDFAANPERETEVHAQQLKRLGKLIRAKHPALDVELLLIDLNGKVEEIARLSAGHSSGTEKECT
ncbi:MAG: carbonic anhydrase [Burkholderiales bacterium]